MPVLHPNITANGDYPIPNKPGTQYLYTAGDIGAATVTLFAKDADSGHGAAIEEYQFTSLSSQKVEGDPSGGWFIRIADADAQTNISIGEM